MELYVLALYSGICQYILSTFTITATGYNRHRESSAAIEFCIVGLTVNKSFKGLLDPVFADTLKTTRSLIVLDEVVDNIRVNQFHPLVPLPYVGSLGNLVGIRCNPEAIFGCFVSSGIANLFDGTRLSLGSTIIESCTSNWPSFNCLVVA